MSAAHRQMPRVIENENERWTHELRVVTNRFGLHDKGGFLRGFRNSAYRGLRRRTH